jgi:SPX domain protein involved in polyphosphate accumulation
LPLSKKSFFVLYNIAYLVSMKFGKELLRAVAASEAVVGADTWLDYKVLKKMLKKMPPTEGTDNSVPDAEKIIKSVGERQFFRALSNELLKVETRFTELKERSLALAQEFSAPALLGKPLQPNELRERLTKCASAHLFVLLVENYAVLNYCGFTKILKKHDKLRSTSTKVKYMSKMVNDRNFAKFDDVRAALEKLETTFSLLTHMVAEERTSSPPSAVSTTANGIYDAQRKELVDINMHGMDRLKSLAHTALLSLEEHENSSDDTDEQRKRPRRS